MKKTFRAGRVILSTLFCSFLIILLTFATLAVSDLLGAEILPKRYPEGIPAIEGPLRMLTVRTSEHPDFPSQPNLPAKTQRAELEEIAQFAQTYGYNAILFEAAPEGDALFRSKILQTSAALHGRRGGFSFFDPLSYLTNLCKERNIQVYALLDPSAIAKEDTHSDQILGKVTRELTRQYDLAGVVLDGKTLPSTTSVKAVHKALAQKDIQRVGLIAPFSAPDAVSHLLKAGIHFVLPAISSERIEDTAVHAALLAQWNEITEKENAVYYPMHTVTDQNVITHTFDNSYWFERQNGASGNVINSYSSLHTNERTAAFSLAATFAWNQDPLMPDLSYPRTFAVGRPDQALTLGSQYSSYFITGTSDPAQPIFFEGREIQRVSNTGLWGVLVDVEYGKNTYTFSQGDMSSTVTITRNTPAQESSTISSMVKSSVYPANSEAVLSGKPLKLSVTAPAGGTVTATVGGLSTTLHPVAQTTQQGIPVVYQATLDVSSLAAAGQVKALGPVTYRLNYAGMNSSLQSAGTVYAAGKGAVPIAQMKGFMTPISANGKDDGSYSTLLKRGCVVPIAENNGGAYYKLSTGDYVLKSAVAILEGAQTAQNQVSAIRLEETEKGEKLILTGTAHPAFYGKLEEQTLTITLHNIEGFEKLNVSSVKSKLCSEIRSELSEDGILTLTFELAKDAKLLGWDVQFEGNDTILYLKKQPHLNLDSAQPLTGITVLLDPGHGGADPGAGGIPHHNGAWEDTLNLANAYALRARLKALGATVHLTQEGQSMTLDSRLEMAEQVDADIFLSSHHNSLDYSVDSNSITGVEVYHYNAQSASLAADIGQSLAEDTGRPLRFTKWSWYRVTMMTACPAVLIESGYLCSPRDYENISSDFGMYQYANAVTDSVLRYFR